MTQFPSPIHQPEASSCYYLWEHPMLPPRVARVEDADFSRSNPQWVRGYPVEIVPPAQVGTSGASAEVSDAMVTAYLDANDAYWRRTDEMAKPPDRWRTGSPREATRESLQAALATMSSPAAKVGTEDADAQATRLEQFDSIEVARLWERFRISDEGQRAIEYLSDKAILPHLSTIHGALLLAFHAGLYVPAPQPPEATPRFPFAGIDPKFCPGSNPENPQEEPPEAMAPTAPVAAVGGPYGQVTTHSVTGQQFFYRWPHAPYLDNASECVCVYLAAPQPRSSPLTDEQIAKVAHKAIGYDGTGFQTIHSGDLRWFAQCIEVAHGIVPDPSLQTR